MAVQGKTINWSNYTGAVSATWRSTYDTGKTSAAVYPTIYVYAPAFQATANAYGSGLWGWQYAALTVYYLNSSGGWTQAWSDSGDARGSGNSYTVEWKHNFSGGYSGDVHDIHTWKVVGDIHGDGNGRIRIWVAGIEVCSASWYHTYCVPAGTYGRQVRGIGCSYSTSSYETTGSRRGTPISEASGTYKMICN